MLRTPPAEPKLRRLDPLHRILSEFVWLTVVAPAEPPRWTASSKSILVSHASEELHYPLGIAIPLKTTARRQSLLWALLPSVVLLRCQLPNNQIVKYRCLAARRVSGASEGRCGSAAGRACSCQAQPVADRQAMKDTGVVIFRQPDFVAKRK